MATVITSLEHHLVVDERGVKVEEDATAPHISRDAATSSMTARVQKAEQTDRVVSEEKTAIGFWVVHRLLHEVTSR